MLPTALVRETTEWVVGRARHCTIDQAAVEALVAAASEAELADLYTLKAFDRDLHYVNPDNPELTIQYLLVVDALNFCFWPDAALEYADLAGGIKRSVEEDPSLLDANRLATIDEEGVSKLLRWPRALPLAAERARLLREVGSGLVAHFGGQAAQLVAAAQGSAAALVDLVTATFPGFRDHAVLAGRQIFFYKRAQIFVGDVYGAFEGQGLGHFDDINELTMFADYRVPQVLREAGVLRYSTQLERKIDSLEEIAPGSEEEIEIRAATVVAVERLRAAVAAAAAVEGQGRVPPPAVHVDWWLWELGERERERHRPHHRTLTVYY